MHIDLQGAMAIVGPAAAVVFGAAWRMAVAHREQIICITEELLESPPPHSYREAALSLARAIHLGLNPDVSVALLRTDADQLKGVIHALPTSPIPVTVENRQSDPVPVTPAGGES